jgi:hypothetical protein
MGSNQNNQRMVNLLTSQLKTEYMAKLPGSLVPEATARFLKSMFEEWRNLNILMIKMVFEILEMLLTNGNVTLPVIIFKSYSGLMFQKLSDRNFN